MLMMVITVEVVGRYVFNSPLVGANELVEVFLCLMFFTALPLLCRSNDHIAVDLLEGFIGEKVKRWRHHLVQAMFFVALSTLSYGLYLLGQRARRDGQISEILGLPDELLLFTVAGLLLFSVAICLKNVFTRLGIDEDK